MAGRPPGPGLNHESPGRTPVRTSRLTIPFPLSNLKEWSTRKYGFWPSYWLLASGQAGAGAHGGDLTSVNNSAPDSLVRFLRTKGDEQVLVN